MKTFIFALILLCAAANANAAIIYQLDESASFSHTTLNPLASPGSASLTGGTFAWGSLSTDSTPNTASFLGSNFNALDWGGDGTYTSTSIDVSAFDSVTVRATGSSAFNVPSTEFFRFFYQLDATAPTNFVDANSGQNVNQTLALSTTGFSSLRVGFAYNHNGSGDTANVSALSVESVAVPEPSSALAVGVAGVAWIVRRRRKNKKLGDCSQ